MSSFDFWLSMESNTTRGSYESSAVGRSADFDGVSSRVPGVRGLTPGFMPSSAPRTGAPHSHLTFRLTAAPGTPFLLASRFLEVHRVHPGLYAAVRFADYVPSLTVGLLPRT